MAVWSVNSDGNLAEIYAKKKGKKKSALASLGKRASKHVPKFQVENRKTGSRNQNFCVAHRNILSLYGNLVRAISL